MLSLNDDEEVKEGEESHLASLFGKNGVYYHTLDFVRFVVNYGLLVTFVVVFLGLLVLFGFTSVFAAYDLLSQVWMISAAIGTGGEVVYVLGVFLVCFGNIFCWTALICLCTSLVSAVIAVASSWKNPLCVGCRVVNLTIFVLVFLCFPILAVISMIFVNVVDDVALILSDDLDEESDDTRRDVVIAVISLTSTCLCFGIICPVICSVPCLIWGGLGCIVSVIQFPIEIFLLFLGGSQTVVGMDKRKKSRKIINDRNNLLNEQLILQDSELIVDDHDDSF